MNPQRWAAALFLAASSVPTADDALGDVGAVVEHGKAATADASPVDPGTWEIELGYALL
jgi:hypothetical protein